MVRTGITTPEAPIVGAIETLARELRPAPGSVTAELLERLRQAVDAHCIAVRKIGTGRAGVSPCRAECPGRPLIGPLARFSDPGVHRQGVAPPEAPQTADFGPSRGVEKTPLQAAWERAR